MFTVDFNPFENLPPQTHPHECCSFVWSSQPCAGEIQTIQIGQKETKTNTSVQIRSALPSGKIPFDASCSLSPPSLFDPPVLTFESTNCSDVSITGQLAKVGISDSLSLLHFWSHPQSRRVGRIMKSRIFSCCHVLAEKSYLLKVMLNCMIDISFQIQIQFNWDSGNRKN